MADISIVPSTDGKQATISVVVPTQVENLMAQAAVNSGKLSGDRINALFTRGLIQLAIMRLRNEVQSLQPPMPAKPVQQPAATVDIASSLKPTKLK